jgi:hypothetical protein
LQLLWQPVSAACSFHGVCDHLWCGLISQRSLQTNSSSARAGM